MEFSISASCFFVESSMVDWEVLVWDEFCKCNRVDKVIERAVDVPLVGTKIEGYGQHVSFTLGSDIALDVEPASPRRDSFRACHRDGSRRDGHTSLSNFLYSASFLALYSSISFAASLLASFSF
jgi:hypothetical protein